MAKELTKRQRQILDFIVDEIRENRTPPTFAEIGAHFGISSTNGVNDHLAALERKGYITRSSSKARSIQVTEKAATDVYGSDASQAPLVGSIAAGLPILAEENIEGHVPLDARHARPGVFALRVRGESMIEDGILDGDIIVVDPNLRPREGDVVVALVDDEATVKHFYRHGDVVELRPANSTMEPLMAPGNKVRLQGVVVALQRSIR
jgi:repressor LexA